MSVDEKRDMIARSGRSHAHPDDPDLVLWIPEADCPAPELSIVIPALDEARTIASFMDWCLEGIEKAGIAAEVLIIDSSTDETAKIALAKGARVLITPKRGLGRAYRDAVPLIRGKYVILGDADCTYDFREIAPFVEKLRQGVEFVMGSRFAGSIEAGAMPALHRYLGTPISNFIINLIYGTRFSDFACGMRGLSTEALRSMKLRSPSWEYASEMIIKSARLKLSTGEVPVSFRKDVAGRLSHHKRIGWRSPWHAGWINLRIMLIHGADFLVFKPGLVMLALGLAITLALAAGPLKLGSATLSLNSMALGASLAIVGLQSIFLGCMAQSLYDPTGAALKRWVSLFSYTRVAVICALAFALGFALCVNFLLAYVGAGFAVTAQVIDVNHGAIAGLLAIILSFITFVSTLVLHAIEAHRSMG